MRPTPEVHDALALLLSYPGEGKWAHQAAAVEVVATAHPETREPLTAFAAHVEALTPGEREELYTHTFDSNDERSLEVGWQLFGENYSRGALLVRLRQFLKDYGIEEQTELPDHLTHVLPLIARAKPELASALAGSQVGQAVGKMTTALREFESPYVSVLEVVSTLLKKHVAQPAQELAR
ncbi:MAG: nitrate reductase molybdenum cofactor assembly chaperone [bacterium]|nr:nitrate reductase molybdenum cofactor assembly chaperone [bacterium]